MNAPLVRVKLVQAINQNPDSYQCERSLTFYYCTGPTVHTDDIDPLKPTVAMWVQL